MSKADSIGRSLPHAPDAEEYLLACCLLDGRDVIARCHEAKIKGESFYDPKHALIYEKLMYLFHREVPIDISVLAEELRSSRDLEKVGGFAFLTQISMRIPTTAQVGYFIGKVREQAMLRELIRKATGAVEDCYNFTGGIDEFVAETSQKISGVLEGNIVAAEGLRGAMSYDLPPENDPNALLGRNRYIGRGDGALIVSSSGMGKSVLQVEWAVHAALGRPFLGISTRGKLTSLIIQSEDSDGDIGEVIYSLKISLKLTPEECAEVDKRVIFKREKVARGEAFIFMLRALVNKVKPDLVWLNPLHAFAGCDIADAREMGNFLRAGLNGVNQHERFAYMIIHHTPKPMTGKGVSDKKWHEFMYEAAGSAELVNWARAVLTLKPTETEGHFNLVLAKRGKRAGVFIKTTSESGVEHLELVTKIPIRHSTESVKVEGRQAPFSIVHWVTRAPDKDEPKTGRKQSQFEETHDNASLIAFFPPQSDEGHTFAAITRIAAEGCGASKSTLIRRVKQMKADEYIEQMTDGRYRRTARGDALATETLKARP